MNIFEKLSRFAKPYADESYEENYENENDDYQEEAQEEAPRTRRTSPFAEGTDTSNDAFRSNTTSTGPTTFTGRVVSSDPTHYQMYVYHATSFAEVKALASELKLRKGLIVNMEGQPGSLIRRVVDFLSGCAFIMDGNVKPIATSTYFFYANNADVEGKLDNLSNDADINL